MPGIEIKSEDKTNKHLESKHTKNQQKAAAITGGLEALVMFPFDKYKNLRQLGQKSTFKEIITHPVQRKEVFSYKGLSPYIFHKVGARFLVLGAAQPFFFKELSTSTSYQYMKNFLGERHAKTFAATLSGGFAGILEVGLNPIDRWKLICQKKNVNARSALYLMHQEGFLTQYAGWRETAKRNVLGASATFFAKFFTYDLLGLKDHKNPTLAQSFISSMAASSSRILISHFADVAKNRAQMDPNNKMTIRARLADIQKNEGGIKAITAGALPKLGASVFKFAMTLTVFDMITREFNRRDGKKEDPTGELNKVTPSRK